MFLILIRKEVTEHEKNVKRFCFFKKTYSRYTYKRRAGNTLYFACLCCNISFFYPNHIDVMTSEDVYDLSVSYIPKHFTLDNIKKAAELLDIGNSYLYSFQFVFTVAFLQTVSCTMAGYGLARFKFFLNKPLLILAVVGLVLPPVILQIPLYTFFRNFRLFGLIPLLNNGQGISFINTQLPSIFLAVTASGFRCGLYILIMRQYFRTMPPALEEAAYIDGAGPVGAFIRIMVPGSLTMMITVFLFAFVWTWLDSDFVPIFMGDTEMLSNLAASLNGLHSGGATDEVTRNLIAYAGILFLIVPLLVLYAALFCSKRRAQRSCRLMSGLDGNIKYI